MFIIYVLLYSTFNWVLQKKNISVWQKGTISDCMYNIYNGLTIYSEIRKTGHNFVIFNEVANN